MSVTVTPKPPFDTGDDLVALCVWRESRGCNYTAKQGVVWVLRNRVAMHPAQGFASSIEAEILRPWQFSSFNRNDPNSEKYPDPATDPVWQDCLDAAGDTSPDPTGGAVFYFSRPITEPPPGWGHTVITAVIDGLTFCGLPPTATT